MQGLLNRGERVGKTCAEREYVEDVNEDVGHGPGVPGGIVVQVGDGGDCVGHDDEYHGDGSGWGDGVREERAFHEGDAHGRHALEHGQHRQRDGTQGSGVGEDVQGEE
ncbi:hypothetical protein FGB62_4g127 [Gracilaria domingensis]|nr:hypothetical protein FGB62_4g127 [Gracilaria domingensis]